jgi:hypothetical protein
VILESLDIGPERFASGTGWTIEPEGACKGDACVPLGRSAGFDLAATAQRLGMALVHDTEVGLWALRSAEAPELVLSDVTGEEFRLSSLRGQKVLLVAWAPW